MSYQPPGLLPVETNPDVVMMICTAGHVDHGKTLLVKMLTGCSTDRLKEEQERGMTIELGFAPCFLGNNLCVGIVDVPGHEKFVKTMVAGVSGIGLTVLVIAADDGIMPQTVEHLQIMELLGVRQGLIALTKIDLVDEARIRQCQTDIRAFTKGTFLAEAPICPVSSKTFDGYGDFYDCLVSRIRQVVRQRKPGVFRMPIEQIFALSGQGTVITGIPVDGAINVGAQVELVPGEQTGRIRGIQRFLRDANQGGYGQCLALNIPDFNKTPPQRGQVLSIPGYLKAARCLHVGFNAVPGLKKALHNAEEVRIHTGTSEETGKLYLLDETEIGPGGKGLASLVLDNPIAVAVHDRFILRRPSPPATVAGGEILSVTLDGNRPRKAHILPQLKAHEAFFAGVDPFGEAGLEKRVEWWLTWERKPGAGAEEISKGVLVDLEAVKGALARLVEAKKLLLLSENYYIQAGAYRAFREEVEQRIHNAGEGSKALSLTLADLRRDFGWPQALWHRIEADLVQSHQIERRGDRVIIAKAVAQMPPEDRALLDRLVKTYEDTGYQSPRPEELPELLKEPAPRVQRLLQHLFNEKRLIKLSSLVVLSYGHYKQAQDLVVNIITQKGVLNSGNFKQDLNTSRKYALAVLDFMDARRITLRTGNDRKLTADFRKNLL
jgi:selenocysteine-specific elongation factor